MPTSPLFSAFASRTDLALDDSERAGLIRFVQKLIQTPSPSTQEAAVAALVQAELRAGGVTDVTVDRAGNVIARLGTGSGPILLYDAHMDTVQPAAQGWPFPPYEGTLKDGVIYGLGACDMKSALGAMVYAARRLVKAQAELHGTLALAFVVQEEPCEGHSLKLLLEEQGFRPSWVILGEPSAMQIKRGHRGRVLFRVVIRGRSSHGASPELGENAVTAAAKLVFGVDLLSTELPADPFLGPGTVAVTHIESHSPSLNAIPDLCTLHIDRRLTLGETPTRAQTQIESIIEREGIHAEVHVARYEALSYTGLKFQAREAYNAWVLEENHHLIQTLSTAVRLVRGHSPATGPWPFSTDGAYSMGEANIATAGFGPGHPELAHTAEEHVSTDEVIQAANVYALLAAMLLSTPA